MCSIKYEYRFDSDYNNLINMDKISEKWGEQRDLNSQPLVPQTNVLPIELCPP